MKKSLIIIALTLLQCACATQEPRQAAGASMPGFDAISAEITVGYEKLDPVDDGSQTVSMNRTEFTR